MHMSAKCQNMTAISRLCMLLPWQTACGSCYLQNGALIIGHDTGGLGKMPG